MGQTETIVGRLSTGTLPSVHCIVPAEQNHLQRKHYNISIAGKLRVITVASRENRLSSLFLRTSCGR